MFKADSALDAASASAANAPAPSNANAPPPQNGAKKSVERKKVQAKLDLATALSHLGYANYEKAAIAFLNLGPASQLGDWLGKVRLFLQTLLLFTNRAIIENISVFRSFLLETLQFMGHCALYRVYLARLSSHLSLRIPCSGCTSSKSRMCVN